MSYHHCKKQLIAWLDGQAPLPGDHSSVAAHEVMGQAIKNLRQAIRQLEQPADVQEQLATLLRAKEKVYTLLNWNNFMDNDDGRRQSFQATWDSLAARTVLDITRSPAMAILKDQAQTHEDPAWRRSLSWMYQSLKNARKVNVERTRLDNQRERRLDRENEHREKQGVFFSDEEVAAFPKWMKDTLKDGQRQHHWESNWLPKNHSALYDSISCLSDERAREVVWECTQIELISGDELRTVLKHRRSQSVPQFPSFAHATMRDHVEPRPEIISRMLQGMLKQLAPAYRAYWSALQKIADVKFEGIEAGKPWNTSFLKAGMFDSIPDSAQERDDLFPVEPTLRKVLRDVLPAIGWNCVDLPNEVPGVHAFQCENEQGRTLTLWIRPFARKEDWAVEDEAICTTLGLPWESNGHTACALSLYMDPDAPGLTPIKIVQLVHELGHVGHFMSMDETVPLCDQVFPQDLIELPSQLLERYVTPDRLAAWVRPTASEVYRSEAYWKERCSPKRDPWVLDTFITEVMHSALDLSIHREGRPSFERYISQIKQLAGAPAADPRDRLDNTALVWDDEYAGRNFIYLWGRALIERLLPVQPPASTVARSYRQFVKNIGSPALSAGEVRASWKKWRDEPLHQSAVEGAKGLCEKISQQNQAMLAYNPLLKESLHQEERQARRRRHP